MDNWPRNLTGRNRFGGENWSDTGFLKCHKNLHAKPR
ncbi:MAG: hypothetical protein ACI8RT_001311, partial [Candidatus Azotimanducaceae bacterium]